MTEILSTKSTSSSASSRRNCPIAINLNGQTLTPESLVRAALSNSTLGLTLKSETGQNLYIEFTEDRSLISSNLLENPSTSSPISHCHFHGFTEGERNALSACSKEDIVGFILTRDNRFGLVVKNDRFVLTPYVIDNCNFGSHRQKRAANSTPINRKPSYIDQHLDKRKRYVELAVFADYSIYQKFDSDREKVKQYIDSTINMLNSLYESLYIHVSLADWDVWDKGNKVDVIEDSGKTLQNFHEYMKETLRKKHRFDTGYMLTNLRFDDGVVGKAYKGTMCSYEFSAGIYVAHSEDFITTVATLAHELGHTFGMDHDPNTPDADVCYCPMPKCIMSSESAHVEVWSECSVKNLASAFSRGVDLCLLNIPGKVSTNAVCGNHEVESGEECDCGPIECPNKCCDYKTCKFIGDATCASGECCDLETCTPKPRATVCRSAIGLCDLDEYCNGETSECPADFFVQNGANCPGREKEFCYDGTCGSREDTCTKIWGETGHDADDKCYAQNTRGTFHGNCGYDVQSKTFKKCEVQNNKCGRLQCETQAERPIFGDPNRYQSSHSSVRLADGNTKTCYIFKQEVLHEPDLGLVPNGAECGPDDMCIGQKCQKKSKITKVTSQCLDNCNFRGVCNNVGNCHCERGFGGVSCEIPGYGGSVNSNEAYQFRGITVTSTFLVIFFFLGFFIAGLCVYYRVKRQRNLPSEWWSVVRKKFDLHGDLVPVRRAPPPPYAQRIRQSFTAMWGDSAPPAYSAPPRQPPKFDPPCIPMATFKDNQVSSPTPLLHSNPVYTSEVYPAVENPRCESSNSFNRNGSLRPNFQPPPIPRPSDEALNRLREELNDEKFEKISKPKVAPPPLPIEKPKTTTLKRNESMRPDVAPPPPPAHMKPALPEKPSKTDVKQLTAKFESKK